MTHPAITAAVTAARDFAEAMEAANAALNAPADPTGVKVGDVAATKADALALLGRLPEGAKVTDRDGDSWTKTGDGRVSFLDEGEGVAQDPENAARYVPLTVTSLPAAMDKPTFKRGDKVRITGLSRYGAYNIGRTGTVGDPEYAGGDVEVFVGGVQYVYPPANIVAETEPTQEPVPTELRLKPADNRGREIRVEPAYYRGGSAYIRVDGRGTESSDIWLSPDEARRVAATLNEIAGPPSPF